MVRKCVVIAREDTPGVKQLVAYVVRENKDDIEGTTVTLLKQHLTQNVADYMIPTLYVFLDILPMTPSGKLDRKPASLPVPNRDASVAGGEIVLPRNDTEAALSKQWCEVGRNDLCYSKITGTAVGPGAPTSQCAC